jgi:hypothetical protein
MRSLLISGIVVGALLSARAAAADCIVPVWLGTESGTHVPTRGVLYMHDESIGWSSEEEPWLVVRWENGEGTIKVTRVERSLAVVEYEGPTGSTIHLGGRFEDSLASYVLDDTWQPSEAAPRVLQYWHHETSWTCSEADSLMVQVDQPVAAFRVRWYVNGRAVDYYETPRARDGKTVLELGKIDCGQENVPLEQLHDGVGIQLFAIRADGTEVQVSGMPVYISLDEIPAVGAGMDHAFTIIATQDPNAAVHASARRPVKYSGGLGAVIIAFAGVGVLLALWLIRRAETAASDCSPAS